MSIVKGFRFCCYVKFMVSVRPDGTNPKFKIVPIMIPDNRGISDVKEGFWVNKKLEWSVLSEVTHFITPNQIVRIDKL